MRKDKKDDEAAGVNPYALLDKATVIQKTRIFNETPVNARKCIRVLCELLYLLQHGETIGKNDATDTFFAITKLWQVKNVTVRLLVYLAIKELCNISNDIIIVTSSLTKDMTGREDIYRPSAIRALCRITDTGMLQSIERYMKQAIVDKNPSVSSAALVSLIHLIKKSPEVIRRWTNEVQEAVSSENHMVQYHALGLLYQIRCNDRLAVSKIVQKFSNFSFRSPLAVCYLIRIAYKIAEENETENDRTSFNFIESCLRHKNEMVVYEAASTIIKFSRISSGELASAVSVLQLFCSSPKPALRFAAVRTLNCISMTYPQAVVSCNVDFEQLITDQNRSIATLAITTLLKTGSESSVERLMKQIGTFVNEISDEFKIVVIEAIRLLCERYPRKHTTMMNFLASMLRDEGGFEYKKAIVDTIILIVNDNPSVRDIGLSHLCEFIEDCEHPTLATRVLYLLGREGPSTQNPSRYIRFIYNRVILETTQVRAAAVTTLAKFGAECVQLRDNIKVLLKRCLFDTDDEVRDRAVFYLSILKTNDSSIISELILNTLKVSIVGLERLLEQYLLDGNFEKPFDIKQVPLSTQTTPSNEIKNTSLSSEVAVKTKEKSKASRQEIYAEQIAAIPEFANLGPLFKSSKSIQLTESVAEYTVFCIKHIFNKHILLQFDCCNTLNDQLLENVIVTFDENPDWIIEKIIPIKSLPYSVSGTIYFLLKLPEDGTLTGLLDLTLKFKVKDVDPVTGEADSDNYYDDVYALEPLEILISDFILPFPLSKSSFTTTWDSLTSENEVDETYSLSSIDSIELAVKNLINCIGLGPCEHTDKIQENKTSHILLMSGIFRNEIEVLSRVRLALNPVDKSVTMNITIRSTDKKVSELISNMIE